MGLSNQEGHLYPIRDGGYADSGRRLWRACAELGCGVSE